MGQAKKLPGWIWIVVVLVALFVIVPFALLFLGGTVAYFSLSERRESAIQERQAMEAEARMESEAARLREETEAAERAQEATPQAVEPTQPAAPTDDPLSGL